MWEIEPRAFRKQSEHFTTELHSLFKSDVYEYLILTICLYAKKSKPGVWFVASLFKIY